MTYGQMHAGSWDALSTFYSVITLDVDVRLLPNKKQIEALKLKITNFIMHQSFPLWTGNLLPTIIGDTCSQVPNYSMAPILAYNAWGLNTIAEFKSFTMNSKAFCKVIHKSFHTSLEPSWLEYPEN